MPLFADLLKAFSPLQDGFFFMWGLALMALFALLITIERWIEVGRRTDINARLFMERVRTLVADKKVDEAHALCLSGGKRVLPSIVGAGIAKVSKSPHLVRAAMEEEFLRLAPAMNRRLDIIMMFGNVSTLLGLMGTIYGLILSFSAVGMPGVTAVEKSVRLASGISTAMNTTLFGLIISIPCILIYSMFRTRIDDSLKEVERYSYSLLRLLSPDLEVKKGSGFSASRHSDEPEGWSNIGSMMSLIVILIPLLLSSAEFVKIGALEIKAPAKTDEAKLTEDSSDEEIDDIALELEIEITDKGFNFNHFFKNDSKIDERAEGVDIPLIEGSYDFNSLNESLGDLKRMTLFEMLKTISSKAEKNRSLMKLYSEYYINRDFVKKTNIFKDHENVRISADEGVKYQTIVSTMDAARNIRTEEGRVTMFPVVSLSERRKE